MLSDISLTSWREADDRSRVLQVIQPGLIGLIDGTLSTLAPIFAAAYVSGSRAAVLVGIAPAAGAGRRRRPARRGGRWSAGVGRARGRARPGPGGGNGATRGAITGVATF